MSKQRKRLFFWVAVVVSLIFVAVIVPIFAPYPPDKAVMKDALQAPSFAHLFGTDKMGRDLFSRVIYGARTSLASTGFLVAMVVTLGGTLGILAGYLGGKIDTFIMRIADMMVSFPGMALAIAMAGLLGPSLINAVIAIALVTWTKYARLSRSLVLKMKGMDYVAASRLSGSSTTKIFFTHLIPAVLPTLVVTASSDMGGLMLELAGFSFLGLGASSDAIEWGYMLNEGRSYMENAPWLMVFPGLAIFITVASFNMLGDQLRDLLDPNEAETQESPVKHSH